MTIKIKRSFDTNTSLWVDVTDSGVYEKCKVQDVFFKLGYCWKIHGKDHLFYDLEFEAYGNTYWNGSVSDGYILLHTSPHKSFTYLTPIEFFDLVLDNGETNDMIAYSKEAVESGEYNVYENYTSVDWTKVGEYSVEDNGVRKKSQTHKGSYLIKPHYLRLKPKPIATSSKSGEVGYFVSSAGCGYGESIYVLQTKDGVYIECGYWGDEDVEQSVKIVDYTGEEFYLTPCSRDEFLYSSLMDESLLKYFENMGAV